MTSTWYDNTQSPAKPKSYRAFDYYGDGSLKTSFNANILDPNNNTWSVKSEGFKYDTKGLLRNYIFEKHNTDNFSDPNIYYNECLKSLDETDDAVKTEWRYWYNPMSEREQKRMYHSPMENYESVYPWTYYLLGAHNEQYAVYNGAQISQELSYNFPIIKCKELGHESVYNPVQAFKDNINSNNVLRTVFMYPVEFNTFGIGSTPCITYKAVLDATTNTVQWQKQINIADHLGSVRVVLDGSLNDIAHYDYEPFGEKRVAINQDNKNRTTFIGKEKDAESSLNDFGVRKYDEGIGRFTSCDEKWEEEIEWSPYHYCKNNPVNSSDPSGLQEIMFGWQEFFIQGSEAAIKYSEVTTKVGEFGSKAGDFVTKIVADAAKPRIVDVIPIPEQYKLENIVNDATRAKPTSVEMSKESSKEKSKTNEKTKEKVQDNNDKEHRKPRPSTKDEHEKGRARKNQKYTDKKRQHPNWDQNKNKN